MKNFKEWVEQFKENYKHVITVPEASYLDIEDETSVTWRDFFDATGKEVGLFGKGYDFFKGTFRGIPAYFLRDGRKKEVYTLNGKLNPPKPAKAKQNINNPAFWAWFSGSKVVDENGDPLVLYHGTNSSFDEFKFSPYDIGFHFGSIDASHAVFDSKSDGFKTIKAPWAGRNIMPVYLSIKNPLRLKDIDYFDTRTLGPELEKMGLIKNGEQWAKEIYANAKKLVLNDIQDVSYEVAHTTINLKEKELTRQALEKMGYDGIVYSNKFEGGGDSWVAFRKNQIKSSTGNKGNFDPNSPKVNESKI
jgi:hypothetical protein